MQVAGGAGDPDPDATRDAAPRPAALWLAAAAILCLVASGGLMWWQGGATLFGDLVTAALALCF